MEAAGLFNVRPFPATRPDVNFLIKKTDLALVNPPMEPRTELGMREVGAVQIFLSPNPVYLDIFDIRTCDLCLTGALKGSKVVKCAI